MSTLYLVATPIGNLQDASPRARQVLSAVQLIAAENPRITRVLLQHLDVTTPQTTYTDAYARRKEERMHAILQALETGDVALVSDAGMPGLADPGYELIQAALAAGHEVRPIPGPSAIVAAVAASGLPTDQFLFLGFLPRKQSDRRKLLRARRDEPATLVAFETPQRLSQALADAAEVLGDRPVAIAIELTKFYEEFWRGALEQARSRFADEKVRGEITLVIGGATATKDSPQDAAQARETVRILEEEGLPQPAAIRAAARILRWPKRRLYRLIVNEKTDEDDGDEP